MRMESKEKIILNKDTGSAIERYIKSFFHAIDGIIYTTIYEHNMIIMILAMILVIVCGFTFRISSGEWLFCIAMIGIVTSFEMINTAIEALVDLASPEIHPLAKIAKDTASSASLIMSIVSFIGALIIFVPKVAIMLS